ncbi:MAG: PAS domain-containing protein, partial [Acidimicrobiales bacterium]
MSDFQGHLISSRDLVEVLPEGIVFVDEHGVIRHVNGRFEALTGYASEELVGRTVEMLVPPRHRDAHAMQLVAFAENPRERAMRTDLELALLCHDGGELAVDIALAPYSVDGELWTVVTVRDDSARVIAEHAWAESETRADKVVTTTNEELAMSEQRFRLAFEHNTAPTVFLDLEDRVFAVNDSFCRLVGRKREELVGRSSASFTHPEDRHITDEAHRRLGSGEVDQVRYVKRYLHSDGRVVVVEVSRFPARDATGSPIYFVASERDVT